jgi:hypothetical protein
MLTKGVEPHGAACSRGLKTGQGGATTTAIPLLGSIVDAVGLELGSVGFVCAMLLSELRLD